MKYWNTYISLVNRNCSDAGNKLKNLTYWRDSLFAGTIIYLLPFCFIALLPGLYINFMYKLYILSIADILAVAAMAIIAFGTGISLAIRKTIFVCCIYILSCVMIYYLGLSGPGLIFLLASCIFSILIFPTFYTFWSAWVNTFICLCFVAVILSRSVSSKESEGDPVAEWVAVSSNVIFLSFLFAALMPRLFNGLQKTIEKENKLREELSLQQQSLHEAFQLLNQKNGELEQFAYVASHDLKEPLRMVNSFIGLLKSRYGKQLDEKANTYLDFAIQGGARMQKMIGDLLELSRTSGQDMIKEPADLNDILKEASFNIYKLIEETGTEITVSKPLPSLAVSRVDITSLFQNLLSNAIKFRKQEVIPMIQVGATENKEYWLFSIADNGIGIEKDKYEKIFEIFARLHSQHSYEGAGIGLSVCRKVVERHGGRIWLESEEGIGSIFYFTIEKQKI